MCERALGWNGNLVMNQTYRINCSMTKLHACNKIHMRGWRFGGERSLGQDENTKYKFMLCLAQTKEHVLDLCMRIL